MSDRQAGTPTRLRSGPAQRPPLQIRIKPALFRKIRGRAKSEGLSVSEWLRGAAVQELRRKKAPV